MRLHEAVPDRLGSLSKRKAVDLFSQVNGLLLAGAPGRIRTCDLGIRSPSLSPLSYGGLRSPRGHEPWSPVPPSDTSSEVDRPFPPYVRTGDENGLNVMC